MKLSASFQLLPVFLLSCVSSIFAQNYDFDSQLSIQLFHAIDSENPEVFTSRGNITIASITSGNDVSINQKEISKSDIKNLINLARKNKFYRLRADVVGSDGIKKTYLTSSKACHLTHSQLNDMISFFITSDNSGIVGFSHKSVNLDAVPENCDSISEMDLFNEFSTVAELKKPDLAPVVDSQTFINKMEKEREARDRGETKDNRNFLQKYWMYLVPAVILLLISGGVTNPEAPAQAGAR